MDIRRVLQKVAAKHGAAPYIMAIAMMKASPIKSVALAERKKRKKGIVKRVRQKSINQFVL
jgi:hypothetical protein